MNILNKNQWLDANEICIAHGNSAALNLMFEKQRDHQLFFELWNKYLGEMTTVLNYHLRPTGWIIMFRTRSREDIINSYNAQRKKSKKAKRKCKLKDVGRILSEHFRIFLSQYVRRTNALSGRRGSIVMSRFKKYIVQKEADYRMLFTMLMNQVLGDPQSKNDYRANTENYDCDKKMKKDSAWKVGKRIYMGLEKWCKVLKDMQICNPGSLVLRNFLKSQEPTGLSHFSP